jgi:N-acetylneuraminic acid mutarotase
MGVTRVFTVIFLVASIVAATEIVPITSADDQNAWTTKTALPKAAAGLRAEVVSNQIFVFGPQITYEYDLSSWIEKQPMPSSRDYFATATYQNEIYCIGGRSNGPSAANEAYNPLSNSWESKQAMPTPRHGLDANVVNDKIYLISGLVPDNRWPNVNVDFYTTYRLTNVTEEYDPSTDTWTTKSPIPRAAAHYSSAVIGNKIYVFSSNINQHTGLDESLTQIYDPTTDTWNIGNPPPYAVDMAGSTVISNRIYLIGGRSSSLQVAYNQIYDPSTNSWNIGAPLPTARYGLSVCGLGNKIYTFGGHQGSFTTVTLKANNEQYDPSKDIPIQFTPSSTPTQSSTPTPSPTSPIGTINTGPHTPETAPFPTSTVLFIALILLAVVIALVLLYKRNRKPAEARL